MVLYFSADNTKDVDAVTSATPMPDGKSSVKWIADIIHDEVGGDIEPIIPSKDYPLEYNALADAAKAEADNDERPAIEPLEVGHYLHWLSCVVVHYSDGDGNLLRHL